jgi:hypothetical protein
MAVLILLLYYFQSLCYVVTTEGEGWIPDDAFITYRYAENLSAGFPFKYNRTDADATQGFSSFTHMLLLSTLSKAGFDLKVASRLVSILALTLIPIVMGVLLSRVAGISAPFSVMVSTTVQVALFHVYPTLASATSRHLISGMETLFYMLSVAFAYAACCYEAMEGQKKRECKVVRIVVLVSSLVFLFLTRPEGILLAIAMLVCITLVRRVILLDKNTLKDPVLIWGSITFGLIVALYMLFKLLTFGYLLPNPYYVKSGHSLMVSEIGHFPGLKFTLSFFKVIVVPAGLSILLILVSPGKWRNKIAVLALCSPGFGLVASYAGAIHEVAFAYRYEFPYIILVQLLATLGFLKLLGSLPRFQGVKTGGVCVACFFSLFIAWSPKSVLSPSAYEFLYDTTVSTEGLFVDIGKDLFQTGLGEDGVLVTGAAGIMPYFSKFKTIDLWGLNTNELSGRDPIGVSGVWEFVSASEPDVIISMLPPATQGAESASEDPAMASRAVKRLLSGVNGRLELFMHWDQAKMKELFYDEMKYIRDNCVFGAAYELSDPGYYIILYLRSDSPHLSRIVEVLRESTSSDSADSIEVTFINDPRKLVLHD